MSPLLLQETRPYPAAFVLIAAAFVLLVVGLTAMAQARRAARRASRLASRNGES